MSSLWKFLYYLIAIPVGVVLVVLAVANRQPVLFRLDPFNPGNSALNFEMPLFVFFFVALFFGIVIGGLAVWFSQSRWRRLAREEARQVRRLERERESRVPAISERSQG